jgi:hypothetical protein
MDGSSSRSAVQEGSAMESLALRIHIRRGGRQFKSASGTKKAPLRRLFALKFISVAADGNSSLLPDIKRLLYGVFRLCNLLSTYYFLYHAISTIAAYFKYPGKMAISQ